ncbi:MAG: hypothetical protein RMJ88_03875 [Thermogemmata sp.]|nr:hypothetical protein [Thermogemmata sp.]
MTDPQVSLTVPQTFPSASDSVHADATGCAPRPQSGQQPVEAAAEAYKELAQAAGGFIHEIKNRLGTLLLNLQLLAEDFPEGQTARGNAASANASSDCKKNARNWSIWPRIFFASPGCGN